MTSKPCEYNDFKCKNNVYIKHFATENIITHMQQKENQNSIALAEENHSDLISGVYEGL